MKLQKYILGLCIAVAASVAHAGTFTTNASNETVGWQANDGTVYTLQYGTCNDIFGSCDLSGTGLISSSHRNELSADPLPGLWGSLTGQPNNVLHVANTLVRNEGFFTRISYRPDYDSDTGQAQLADLQSGGFILATELNFVCFFGSGGQCFLGEYMPPEGVYTGGEDVASYFLAVAPAAVPVPAAGWLFISAIAGLVGRRKFATQK